MESIKYTQLISFEIGDKCNLTSIHPKCPSNATRHGKELTDELILALITKIYKYGFRGFLAWHYYNEPLLQADRVFSLMEKIKKDFPYSRFLLMTNCTVLPEDRRVKLFNLVLCTDYLNVGLDKLHKSFDGSGWIGYKGQNYCLLDDRFENPKADKQSGRCLKPLIDFIIDNYGEVHFCCYDWSSTVKVGNVWKDSFEDILKKREMLIEKICGKELIEGAPECCFVCTFREGNPHSVRDLDGTIANEAFRKYCGESV